jgi:hypothetical protein
MTTPAQAPAAPTSPAPAPAAEPTAAPAASSRGKRSALADSLEGIDTDDEPEQPAPPTFTPDTPTPTPAEPTPPGQSKREALLAKLKADHDAREAKRAQDEQSTRAKELESKLSELQGKPSYEQFVAEFKRAPAATARKVGMNPRELLDILTQDALAPGSLAAQAQAQDAMSEGKRALEEIEKMRREQAEREEVDAGNRHNAEYIAATAPGPDTKYPYLSKLPEARRLRLALSAWNELRAKGHQYSRELVAEYVEAELEEDHKSWSPSPSPTPATPAPSSPTSAAQPSQAATNKPPKTITPALVGASSGTARRQTPRERREALANTLVAIETD